MAKNPTERQREFVERKKTGQAPERRLALWVPVQTFERFTQLAEKEGRTNTFVRLIEGVPQ